MSVNKVEDSSENKIVSKVQSLEAQIDNSNDNKETKKKRSNTDECIELKNIQYKTMLMNGNTLRESKAASDLNNLEKFLETERVHNTNEPWCKLDKTMKTRKLLVFIEEYKEKHSLDKDEVASLTGFLKDCLSKKKLARVKDVLYDKETGIVKDIPNLLFNKQSKKFTLKNTEKRVSTLKSLPSKKISIAKTSKKKDSVKSIDSIENLDD
tara:strand:+ start:14666 stop:15295 length:630 start_codon:yes stop_codon:yes gene_type:complete